LNIARSGLQVYLAISDRTPLGSVGGFLALGRLGWPLRRTVQERVTPGDCKRIPKGSRRWCATTAALGTAGRTGHEVTTGFGVESDRDRRTLSCPHPSSCSAGGSIPSSEGSPRASLLYGNGDSVEMASPLISSIRPPRWNSFLLSTHLSVVPERPDRPGQLPHCYKRWLRHRNLRWKFVRTAF
jgi:hypothetical protein